LARPQSAAVREQAGSGLSSRFAEDDLRAPAPAGIKGHDRAARAVSGLLPPRPIRAAAQSNQAALAAENDFVERAQPGCVAVVSAASSCALLLSAIARPITRATMKPASDQPRTT
jgi:hypothetical protein